MDSIHKIVIVIKNINYDKDILQLKLNFIHQEVILNLAKTKTIGNNNIYTSKCTLPNEYLSFKIGHCVKFGGGGSLNDDDFDYNHCQELCDDELTQAQEFETTYSVNFYCNGDETMFENAITVYVFKKAVDIKTKIINVIVTFIISYILHFLTDDLFTFF